MHRSFAAVLLFAIGAFAGTAQATTIIDTIPMWDGTSFVYQFGAPDTQTYGQVVTVPLLDSSLDSFSFEMSLPASLTFSGYVYAWDGNSASGTQLFASGPTQTAGSGSFELITFNTGGLALTPGGQYVLFASSSAFANLDGDLGSWGQPDDQDLYLGADNGFVFINNGTDTSQWTSGTWTEDWLADGADLAFSASFSDSDPVPEPGTLLLLGSGLFGLAARRRQSRP